MASTGLAIKLLRQAQERSVADLAKAAGISNSYLSLIESNQKSASLDVLHKIAAALGVPVAALILAGTEGSTLDSRDKATNRIVTAINALAEAENQLRKNIKDLNPSEKSRH